MELRRSLRVPESGGNSIGDAPWFGERLEVDEQSDMRDGAPSADIWEKAEGDGNGVSIIAGCRKGGPFDGTLICCGMYVCA